MPPDDDLSEDSSSRDTRTDEADAEGVWSLDIEEAFKEAMDIYPPCGRRKIILSDEGKMYGRNELIARYIKLRTGKARTRKQVSSHIQVLARRRAREVQSKMKTSGASNAPDSTTTSIVGKIGGMPSTSGAAVGIGGVGGVASGVLSQYGSLMAYPHTLWPNPSSLDIKPFQCGADTTELLKQEQQVQPVAGIMPAARPPSPMNSTRIRSSKLKLCKFSAFVESRLSSNNNNNNNNTNNNNNHNNNNNTNSNGSANSNGSEDDAKSHLFVHIGPSPHDPGSPLEAIDIRQIYDKFPDKKGGLKELFDRGPSDAFFLVKFWADLNTGNITEDHHAFYGMTSVYESSFNATISCSTKVCSFGKQVVEKVETEYPQLSEDTRKFIYCVKRSPMCEYVINFIHKLKRLPEKYMMNSVLENFTILQVVSNRDTQETLLCIAYVFEVSSAAHGTQHHVYRLVKD